MLYDLISLLRVRLRKVYGILFCIINMLFDFFTLILMSGACIFARAGRSPEPGLLYCCALIFYGAVVLTNACRCLLRPGGRRARRYHWAVFIACICVLASVELPLIWAVTFIQLIILSQVLFKGRRGCLAAVYLFCLLALFSRLGFRFGPGENGAGLKLYRILQDELSSAQALEQCLYYQI